jgi:hypothetical protein
MSDTQASEAARTLVSFRWRDQVLRRSASVVLERADLSAEARSELETIAGCPAGDGDDAA